MIGLIKRNFINMDSRTFIMLYKALVCPHVDMLIQFGPLSKKGNIEAIKSSKESNYQVSNIT